MGRWVGQDFARKKEDGKTGQSWAELDWIENYRLFLFLFLILSWFFPAFFDLTFIFLLFF